MNPYSQTKSVPGMEFFQSMFKGSGMPSGFASWMAPTMDPEELDQKITDLKAVLQWLEANARLTQATIQGLEVQRMTLSALKTMNVDLGNLAGRMSDAMQSGAQAMGAAVNEAVDAGTPQEPPAAPAPEAEAASSPLPGVMDPMQWWNAVSQQFTQVASQALRDTPWPMPGAGAGGGAEPVADAAPKASPAGVKGAAKPAANQAVKQAAKQVAKQAAKAPAAPSSKAPARPSAAAKRAR